MKTQRSTLNKCRQFSLFAYRKVDGAGDPLRTIDQRWRCGDESELARFGQITTARMMQIMSLLNLARDIQE